MLKNKKSSTIILRAITKHSTTFEKTLIDTLIAEYGKKPFLILIGCLLSLRAKDKATIHVCRNVFKKAQTPQELLAIETSELEQLIYKIGFYRTKAKVLREVALIIHKKYHDNIPRSREKLLEIPGVGPKTANLVLGLAFDIPAICVDVHVHRIPNRLGIIKTKTPEQTEDALKILFEKNDWIKLNRLFVIWGQNTCTPRTPKCSRCAISSYCAYYKTHH